MHVDTRPFTILPERELDATDSRTPLTWFRIHTCEHCGQLTVGHKVCTECVARRSQLAR